MVHSKNSNTSLLDGVIDFTSGSLGAVALVYVGQPLDTVKVKMQTFPELYQGMWDCMRKTVTTEGIRRGLYAGTVPALAANVAENSVLFAAYGACQKVIAFATDSKDIKDLGVLSNASAGFLAAFFSSFSLCPTELIKIKMQAATEHAAQTKTTVERESAFKITHKILKAEGIMGVFRGIVPTMAREMPGYFFFFGGYEATRLLLTPEGKSKDECGPLRTMAAGAVGGVSFWTAVFPFDVVKSRVQVGQMSDGSLLKSVVTIFKNEGSAESLLEHVDVHELAEMVDTQLQQEVWTAPLELVDKISTMYLEGRLRRVFTPEELSRRFTAMYSGWTPTVMRTIPSTAVLFLVYETSRSILNSFLETQTYS